MPQPVTISYNTMPTGWQCPLCKTIWSPQVNSCRCAKSVTIQSIKWDAGEGEVISGSMDFGTDLGEDQSDSYVAQYKENIALKDAIYTALKNLNQTPRQIGAARTVLKKATGLYTEGDNEISSEVELSGMVEELGNLYFAATTLSEITIEDVVKTLKSLLSPYDDRIREEIREDCLLYDAEWHIAIGVHSLCGIPLNSKKPTYRAPTCQDCKKIRESERRFKTS